MSQERTLKEAHMQLSSH